MGRQPGRIQYAEVLSGPERVVAVCFLYRRGSRLHLTTHESLVRVVQLKKVFRSGESDLVLFENLSFEVRRGEMLALVGASGAGKSTLLHILGALERASQGDVYCANLQLSALPD